MIRYAFGGAMTQIQNTPEILAAEGNLIEWSTGTIGRQMGSINSPILPLTQGGSVPMPGYIIRMIRAHPGTPDRDLFQILNGYHLLLFYGMPPSQVAKTIAQAFVDPQIRASLLMHPYKGLVDEYALLHPEVPRSMIQALHTYFIARAHPTYKTLSKKAQAAQIGLTRQKLQPFLEYARDLGVCIDAKVEFPMWQTLVNFPDDPQVRLRALTAQLIDLKSEIKLTQEIIGVMKCRD